VECATLRFGRMLSGAPGTATVLSRDKHGQRCHEGAASRAHDAHDAATETAGEVTRDVTWRLLHRPRSITDADFSAVLRGLTTARGIVFDMRGYPRQVNTAAILAHLTDTTIHSARFEVPLVALPDRVNLGYVDGAWNIQPGAPRLTARVAFSPGVARSAMRRALFGVVEGYHLGDIVGERRRGRTAT